MGRLEIQSDVKPFTMVKNAIIDSEEILNEHEKLLYIVLTRYGNKAFPSLATISKKCGCSKRTAQRTIETLIEKGLLKKRNRMNKKTGNTSNIYTLIDNDKIWESSKENLSENIEKYMLEEAVRIVESSGMKVIKEKSLANEPTKEQMQDHNSSKTYDNNTITVPNCQADNEEHVINEVERYSLNDIMEIYDYEYLKVACADIIEVINAIMSILHDVLNTTKNIIRIGGENKPSMVVIGKLMKLNGLDIQYVAEKYIEQTERIKNPEAYLLTMLYKAKEQSSLEITNKVHHDMANWNENNLDHKKKKGTY